MQTLDKEVVEGTGSPIGQWVNIPPHFVVARAAIHKSAGKLLALGIVMMVIGLFSILSPAVAGLGVTIFLGALIFCAGIVRSTFAFYAHSWGGGILGFLLGALAIVCGGYMITHPGANLLSLTLLLAGFLIAEGVAESIFAFRFKPMKGWGWMLTSGILGILLGVMIGGQWPISGLWAIGTLVGVGFLFRGATLVSLASAARRFTAAA